MKKRTLKYHDPFVYLDSSTVFEMVNTNEVFERLADLTDAYNNKLLCPTYTWPELLWDEYLITQDEFNSANIDRIISKCLEEIASMGIEISYEDVKPLIEDLQFRESRFLIVETAKAFIPFATSEHFEWSKIKRLVEKAKAFIQSVTSGHSERSKIRRQFIYFEIIPKLEDLTPLYFMGNLIKSED
ncbi:MAG: hypothetical protein K6G50_05570 [bacterium]|nr:hypothetical protein [bacterium]